MKKLKFSAVLLTACASLFALATAASAESRGVGGDLTSDLTATLDFKELESDLIFMC